MNVLHTSDWHIGKRLFNKDLEMDHLHFFEWLVKLINDQKIDVLIVAGDIFDLAFPSNSSLQIYYQMLKSISGSYCKHIVITGGNHDSVSTLNAPKEILHFLNIHVLGGATGNIEDEIILVPNQNGDNELVICAVPFLRDRDIRASRSGETHEERAEAIRNGIAEHYHALAEKVKQYKEFGIPVIATAHLFVSDARMEKDESDMYIGGLQQIKSSQFPDVFDYIALGHVHRPQIIGGNERIRYCGSPIRMSFSDRKDDKIVVMIEFCDASEPKITKIEVPQKRKLHSLRGNFFDVVQKLDQLTLEASPNDWAEIMIVEEKFDPLMQHKISSLVESIKKPEVLHSRLHFLDAEENRKHLFNSGVSLNDLSVSEVFDKLLERLNVNDAEPLKNTFDELLHLISEQKQ